MSTPPAPVVTSRLNVEGYGVAVRAFGYKETWVKRGGEPVTVTREVMPWCVVNPGTVTPDGSLTVEPDPWAPRHYRRAIMRGAGVFQAGLWAMLAAGRGQPDTAQAGEGDGAAPGVNEWSTFALTTPYYNSKRNTLLMKLSLFKHGEVDLVVAVAKLKYPEELHHYFDTANLYGKKAELETFLIKKKPTLIELIAMAQLISIVNTKELNKEKRVFISLITANSKGRARIYNSLLAYLIVRGDRYRAHLARLVKPQRAPRRAPRPLYSRAVPPAAPLAPPAL